MPVDISKIAVGDTVAVECQVDAIDPSDKMCPVRVIVDPWPSSLHIVGHMPRAIEADDVVAWTRRPGLFRVIAVEDGKAWVKCKTELRNDAIASVNDLTRVATDD